jgi:serine/threonine-protein kinase
LLLIGAVAAAVLANLLIWLFVSGGAEGGQDSRVAVLPPAPAPAVSNQPGAALTPTQPPATKPGLPGQVVAGAAAEESKSPSAATTTGAGDPPPGVDPTVTATPTTEPTTTATGKLLKSKGGDVLAKCNGAGKSKLVAWEPKPGWSVYSVAAGPALTTSIVFKKDASKIRMTVTCVAGTPTAVVLPL